MAIKLADTLAPMGDFPAAESSSVEITLTGGVKKSVQKAYEDGDLGGGGSQIQYAVMPPASEHPGEVVQYIGESGTYHKASFYSSEGQIAYCYTAVDGSYTYYFYVKEISPTATIYAKADVENPEATSINELVPISTIGVYAGLSLVSLDSSTLVLTNGSVELTFNHAAAKDLDSYVWVDQTLIDEEYNPSSDNPQSGKAVAEAVATVNPLLIKYPNGKTWQDSNITSGDYRDFGKTDDGTLVVAANGGIKYSTDNGKTWQNSNITSGNYRTLEKTDDGTLVVGSTNSGIKYSTDNGKTWQDSNITSGGNYPLKKADDGTLVVGGTGIKYSIDNGKTWQDTNLTSDYFNDFGKADDGTLIAVGGTGIKYSTDNGKTWQDSNITSGVYYDFGKADDGTLVAGGTGIKYSIDNGRTWQNSNITSNNYDAFGKADDGTLLAGCSGDSGIKYSIDSGKTWQNSNITSDSYYAFGKADDGTLVAGSISRGIKYSVDNGRTWQNSNITSANYFAFGKADDGTLVAGSSSAGIKYSSTTNFKDWVRKILS